MILAAAFLTFTGNAYASCVGRNPGELMAILTTTIQTGAAPTDQNWWRDCLDDDFSNWTVGGSQNLPVIAAAIGMYDRVNTTNPSYDDTMPNSTKTYVQWWAQFLEAQTGYNPQPTPGNIRYFHSSEAFSFKYDGSVVSSVAAINYWGRKYAGKQGSNGAHLAARARDYLRATWVIFGFAAGQGPSDLYDMGTKLDANNQDAGKERVFNPSAPLRDDGSLRFNGRFVALGGGRSPVSHWAADDKWPLFARAMNNIVSRMNENQLQRDLLNELQNVRWPTLGLTESLYGLSNDDRNALGTLVQYGSNAQTFLSWITNIRTGRVFRILGWSSGFRASVMEENMNFNDPCMFAITYDPATRDATFLSTWTDANGSGQGWAKLEPGRIVAWHEDVYKSGVLKHPKMKAYIRIPTESTVFHLVLSQNTAPYLDGTAPTSYPPGLPPRTDWPPNY